jgi:hypothetical protein
LEGENDGNLKDIFKKKKKNYLYSFQRNQASKHPFDAFLENMLVEE